MFLSMYKIAKDVKEDEGNILCAPFYIAQWAVFLASGLEDKVGESFCETMGVPTGVDVNRVYR